MCGMRWGTQSGLGRKEDPWVRATLLEEKDPGSRQGSTWRNLGCGLTLNQTWLPYLNEHLVFSPIHFVLSILSTILSQYITSPCVFIQSLSKSCLHALSPFSWQRSMDQNVLHCRCFYAMSSRHMLWQGRIRNVMILWKFVAEWAEINVQCSLGLFMILLWWSFSLQLNTNTNLQIWKRN